MKSFLFEYASFLISALLAIVLAGVITAAFAYQAFHENPCPLCFLQRVAMIGVAVGQLLNFRFGMKMWHHGVSIFHCLFGMAVSLRQISLHICPGSPTFGSPVLGYSLYTWAFIVFFCSLIAIGTMLCLHKPDWKPIRSKFLKHFEQFAFFYVLLIVVADIVSVAMICGLGPCPDNP